MRFDLRKINAFRLIPNQCFQPYRYDQVPVKPITTSNLATIYGLISCGQNVLLYLGPCRRHRSMLSLRTPTTSRATVTTVASTSGTAARISRTTAEVSPHYMTSLLPSVLPSFGTVVAQLIAHQKIRVRIHPSASFIQHLFTATYFKKTNNRSGMAHF